MKQLGASCKSVFGSEPWPEVGRGTNVNTLVCHTAWLLPARATPDVSWQGRTSANVYAVLTHRSAMPGHISFDRLNVILVYLVYPFITED
jgi:hypothetical protein